MSGERKDVQVTPQQQRVLKLLFKFRYISARLLADSMGIRRASAYEAIENLVEKGLVIKVYDESYRIDRKPAYYFLSQTGVSLLRKLLSTRESTINALYKNARVSEDFIAHCLAVAACYVAIAAHLPKDTDIFTKAEINPFKQFPKNRPDLYIRTADGREAIVVVLDDSPPYIVRKRFDEIVAHSENEGWSGGAYPTICVILRNARNRSSFVHTTRIMLDNMGMEDEELPVLATDVVSLIRDQDPTWQTRIGQSVTLFGGV